MSEEKTDRVGLLLLKGGLTAAFLWFGLTKLFGSPSAVALYEALGFGQWPRYVTGTCETVGAIGLWLPGVQGIAALLLTVTMAVGLGAMLFIIGGAWWHLALLLVLSAIVTFKYRAQFLSSKEQTPPA